MNNSFEFSTGLYNFKYVHGEGLKAEINKDELSELMEDDRKEEKRLEDLDAEQELSDEAQAYKDTGMRPSDY